MMRYKKEQKLLYLILCAFLFLCERSYLSPGRIRWPRVVLGQHALG
jgi:hypothetical protein